MRRYLRIVAAVACVVAIASCGGDGTADGDDREQQMEAERQWIESVLPDASETQREVLDDGFVTPGEVDRAAGNVVDCAAALGVVVTPVWTGNTMAFDTAHGRSNESSDAAMGVFDECYQTEFVLVDSTLALQNALSSDQIARRNQLVVDCLATNGFDVGSWPDVSLDPDPQVEAICVDSALEDLGL